jgi:hypothetical protein
VQGPAQPVLTHVARKLEVQLCQPVWYGFLPVLNRVLPVLYRYSKVWVCNWQEATSQVVLKAYFKSKMRPRHLENVRREVDILGELCKLRYIAAKILCAQCLTQPVSPKGLGQA